MDIGADHYAVLSLPSGEEGARLSQKDIAKAYRKKALELHPDKRPHDPNAHFNFQKLTTSYEILKDEKHRNLFDDLLRVKRENIQRQSQQDSKRRKMMADHEARERAASREEEERIARKNRQSQRDSKRRKMMSNLNARERAFAREEGERIARKLKKEFARIRATHSNKVSTSQKEEQTPRVDEILSSVDKEKVLKVSWDNFTHFFY
ncbi:uncharacterized protein LOC132627645 [Lycium barbarum]|uniref:uncharacterized protein LOC132627645 n=1 Tax=Lycium barbarum TaxID=112863 RepID=UPI00293F258A|nr:uncharacterized protein LOC132627645 [Lycium barbarum]